MKIDLKKIDRHVADEVVGCWNRDNLDWIVLMDNVIVLENKLEKKKFLFKNFPKKDLEIPTLENYHSELPNCFSISLEYDKIINVDGAIIKE